MVPEIWNHIMSTGEQGSRKAAGTSERRRDFSWTWNEARKKAREERTSDCAMRREVSGLRRSAMATGMRKMRVRSREYLTREEVSVIVLKSKGTERVYQIFETLSSKIPLENGKRRVRISRRV
jgi:hypothetical protein